MDNDESSLSVITSEVEIKGTIKSAGSVRIDGKLEGDLVCTGDAIIGNGASIKGTISANSVVIEGLINGTITARDKIEMKATAQVNGDIKSKRLSVEDGVTFIGRSEVNPTGNPVAGAPGKADSAFGEYKPDTKLDDLKSSFLGKSRIPAF